MREFILAHLLAWREQQKLPSWRGLVVVLVGEALKLQKTRKYLLVMNRARKIYPQRRGTRLGAL